MAQAEVSLNRRAFGATTRPDVWWVQPALVFLVFSSFVLYSTWAAFQTATTTGDRTSRRSTRRSCSATARTRSSGPRPGVVAGLAAVLARPADPLGARRVPAHLLLLPRRLLQVVLGRSARLRGGRAARTVTAARSRFPLILQNIHRYFLYLALLFLVILSWDVWKALWFDGRAGFGVGRGYPGAGGQRGSAGRLHLRLPLAAPPGGRLPRRGLARRPSASAPTAASAPSTAATSAGPGPASSRSPSPTSTCACVSMGVWTDLRLL